MFVTLAFKNLAMDLKKKTWYRCTIYYKEGFKEGILLTFQMEKRNKKANLSNAFA